MVLSGISEEIAIIENDNPSVCYLAPLLEQENLVVHRLTVKNSEEFIPKPITLAWKFPAKNVQGVWRPSADFNKRIEADWELQSHESRISIDAPVLSLFGSKDENKLCFSCSNAINRIELSAKYREEDNYFYCKVILFTECKYPLTDFYIDIRIDKRNIHFSQALNEVSKWWESYESLEPAHVPGIAKMPLYSTWYQFHQNLDEDLLLQECEVAKNMGFEAIIIDDGWQTKDNNRGYDYTGDWKPERFENFGAIIDKIQGIGLKVGLWYSVPFCGVKSEAYQKFKGKFLTEKHRWAPVFDPRYPEVRKYLVQTYVSAVKNLGLDGLKLDFIDDFKSYPETNFDWDGKDILSINGAVDLLLSEISREIKKINADIFIEFRQKYTGPAIRKYGNMLRAFDCPGDYVMNRVRIADIKMLAGNTAVHSDMVTWHPEESLNDAALHYMNTLFGVPQISIMLSRANPDYLQMIAFYTEYWKQNMDLLLSGRFFPGSPSENYPVQTSEYQDKIVLGVYSDKVLELEHAFNEIDILNAKKSTDVVIKCHHELGSFRATYFTPKGEVVSQKQVTLKKGITILSPPECGLAQLKKMAV